MGVPAIDILRKLAIHFWPRYIYSHKTESNVLCPLKNATNNKFHSHIPQNLQNLEITILYTSIIHR